MTTLSVALSERIEKLIYGFVKPPYDIGDMLEPQFCERITDKLPVSTGFITPAGLSLKIATYYYRHGIAGVEILLTCLLDGHKASSCAQQFITEGLAHKH